jgi:hypothetical protein
LRKPRMKKFVKSQPDHLPEVPKIVSRWELPLLDRLAFEAALARFDATGEPVFALRTFVLATKMGVYPPQRIMQWVDQAFNNWNDEQGELSMDKAMNLARGRGQEAAYKAALRQERDEHVMAEMDLLIALGAKRAQAAEMVASRLDQEDWNKSRHALNNLKTETLIAMHTARKEKHWGDQEYLDELNEDPDWQEWLRARLQKYNPLSIPPALRQWIEKRFSEP